MQLLHGGIDEWGGPAQLTPEDAGPEADRPRRVCSRWSAAEHQRLVELVAKYGPRRWPEIAQHLPGRKGKQCRERWLNHAAKDRPKRGHWTALEEFTLASLHAAYSTQWRRMVEAIPGRTDNDIKNHFYATMRCKMEDNSICLLWLYIRELKQHVQPMTALINALSIWEQHVAAEVVDSVLGYLPSQRPDLLPQSLKSPPITSQPGAVMPNGTPKPGYDLDDRANCEGDDVDDDDDDDDDQVDDDQEEGRMQGQQQGGQQAEGQVVKRFKLPGAAYAAGAEVGDETDQARDGAEAGPSVRHQLPAQPLGAKRKSAPVNLLAAAGRARQRTWQRSSSAGQPADKGPRDPAADPVGEHVPELAGQNYRSVIPGMNAHSTLSAHSHKSQGSDSAQRNAGCADAAARSAQPVMLAKLMELASASAAQQSSVEVPAPPPMFVRNQREARRKQQQQHPGSDPARQQPVLLPDGMLNSCLPAAWVSAAAGGDLVALPTAFAAGQMSDGVQDSYGSGGGPRASPMPQQGGGPALVMSSSVGAPDKQGPATQHQLPQGCFVDPRLSVDATPSQASYVPFPAGHPMNRLLAMQQQLGSTGTGRSPADASQPVLMMKPDVNLRRMSAPAGPVGEASSFAVPPAQWTVQQPGNLDNRMSDMSQLTAVGGPMLLMQPDGQLVEVWGGPEQQQVQHSQGAAGFNLYQNTPQIISAPSTLNDGAQGMAIPRPVLMQPRANLTHCDPNMGSMISMDACNQMGQYILTGNGQIQVAGPQVFPGGQLVQLPGGQLMQAVTMLQPAGHVGMMKSMGNQRLMMCPPASYASAAPVGYMPIYAEDVPGMMQMVPQA